MSIKYKDLLLENIRFCIKEKGLQVHAYVIMSNHVHMIISKKGDQKLEDIMRDLKKFSSYRILKEIKENSNNTNYQFWKQDNHPDGGNYKNECVFVKIKKSELFRRYI